MQTQPDDQGSGVPQGDAETLRQRRLAENEVRARRVNEAIDRGHAGAAEEQVGFICECGQLGCTEVVTLTLADYRHVRTSMQRFLLVPGHEDVIDEVVEDHGDHLVAEKAGTLGDITGGDPSR